MLNDNLLGAYAVGLILLFVLIKLFYTPLKAALKLCLNALAGGVALFIINFLGQFVGINVGVNPLTSVIVGLLGIPGVSLMLILQILLY